MENNKKNKKKTYVTKNKLKLHRLLIQEQIINQSKNKISKNGDIRTSS